MNRSANSLFSNPNGTQVNSYLPPPDALSESTLLSELPYYPFNEADPIFQFTCDELIGDRFPISKYPFDGFINFHSLKICSSNAKQMSKYLQLAMGFKEVAYRGLENDSRLVASHVVQNGSIFLEIVNTLETIKDDNVLRFPYFEKDLSLFQKFDHDMSSYLEEFKITTEDLVFDYVNNRIESLSTNPLKSLRFGRHMYNTIIKSGGYKAVSREIEKIIVDAINDSELIYNDIMECTLIQKFLKNHAEGVMDIAFNVKSADAIFQKAIQAGAGIIRLPRILSDENGSVKLATVTVPNTDIQHTLIENIDYTGTFLPRYSESIMGLAQGYQEQLDALPAVHFTTIDHCVENYSWNQMISQAKIYANMFGFHKYWSVDEMDVSTGFTALRSIVMSSSNGQIKMPINEPVKSKFKGQIEEFNDFYGGPGVQHIALRTNNIVQTVKALIQRGIEFNQASNQYYRNLQQRLAKDDVELYEDIAEIMSLNILIDYDPTTRNKRTKKCHYILQIFSQPLHDRPTLFIEVIQRHHHNGFGKGTFKGLFETIESQQRLRGTFVEVE
ncbi:4-hydroxyphenylpyruvate dioxygenase [Candida parapsilosis]|uniref:4-hydroxyphenylpyruvate dioxygenase n=1 Tax=Candida parapsilosis TaxID=5480 RepID=A0A8X7TDB6_CANPA|nr:4-hydroxyphenylpyruvate dioxygenase [Candida parapsilosis]KAF6049627.1 4-hydroxyphenylpyruvate dioxygenase [Candida parapsilosis]KAF6057478.1 4-hydroxyphenylpyruvate dioxygenase [Candida parapsilosis]KAF6065803.1 4-hydroxyphenylpyruvate dioxygenase [Candida parapsilosis]KAI5906040.1 4-hydroxyphenylpyruvate dioxygenase 1 [Candida parapsilosis]